MFLTALDALETQGEARPGETVLIHAVGSGVGTAALQIARAMGCTVIGTSRTADKLQKAGELGLDVGIESTRGDFAADVLAYTGGAGADVILDLVGAPVWEANLRALAVRGRLVVVGLLGGGTATVDLRSLLNKRAHARSGRRSAPRPLEEKIAVTRKFARRVVPWLDRGCPAVDRVFLEEVRAAEARLEANLGFGKVVLRV